MADLDPNKFTDSDWKSIQKHLNDTGKGFADYGEKVTTAFSALEKLMALGSRFSGSKTGGMTPAFTDLSNAIGGTKNLVTETLSAMGDWGSIIPGVGGALKTTFEAMELGTSVVGGLAEGFIGATQGALGLADFMSAEMREIDKTFFDFGKQMGGTVEEAKAFGDGMREQTDTGFARSLYITMDAMAEFGKAAGRTSLSQEQLNQTVDTGMGSVKLYSVAAAQAGAMNISISKAADLFNTAMNKQGKSAQDAAELLGMFSGVASTVGLRAEQVAETLNGAVQGFEKLGLSADFGRPILEGFGRTMNDMGLGIENSIGLTQSLSKALAGLTTDYANAYLIFQRGGLDIGGGGGAGVLGSSIGLQAAMLEAEKTGDQSDIASQLTMGLKDTLASFTGGDIVTVQQAAESPELQNQFYVQQQMLKTQFGVGDDASATRILDMLSRLDDATRSGDTDAKQMLEEQLKNEMEGKDQTLDLQEKANQELAIQSNLLALSQREQAEMNRSLGEMLLGGVKKGIVGAGEVGRGLAEKGNEGFDAIVDKLPPDMQKLIRGRTKGEAKGEVAAESGWPGGVGLDEVLSEQAKAGAGDPTKNVSLGFDLKTLNKSLQGPGAPQAGSEAYMNEIQQSAAMVASNTDDATLARLGDGGMTKDELFEALVKQGEQSTTIRIELAPALSEFVKTTEKSNKQQIQATTSVRTTSA